MVTKIKLMKRLFVFLFFVVAMAVWCTPSFAVQTVANNTADVTADGAATGVIMNGTSAILNVNGITGSTVGTTGTVSAINDGIGRGIINFSVPTSVVGGSIGDVTNTLAQVNTTTTTTVTFNGTVFSVAYNLGSGTVNFNSATLGAAGNKGAVTFTGDGTINVAANTSVTGALNDAGAQTGTLNLSGAAAGVAQWIGQVGVAGMRSIKVDNGSIAGVTSQITGAVNTYAFDLGSNMLNITGALTTAPGGTIATTLTGTSAGLYGHVVPTGFTSIGTGLVVTVTVPSGTYIPLGTLFNIVEAASGSGGVFTINDAAASGYTFDAATITNGKVVLVTTKVGTSGQAAVPVAAPFSALVASAALSPDLLGVLSNINALSGSAQDNANAQLTPSTPSLAAPLVTYQGAREFQNLWLSRLDGCGQVSWPSEDKTNCKDAEARSGWWLKGFGYFGEQDARAASTGYNSQIIGSMIAYDEPIGLNTRMGVGVGYARSAIKGKTFDARNDFDTYQATTYIGHEQGPWFVDGSASFGWNEYSDKRHIQFTGEDRRANAKYSGQTYTAFGRTGFHIPALLKFIITPLASLQYSRVNIEGYTEKGANDLSLKVESQHYNYLESGLGAKVERNFNFRSLTLVPEVRFEWLHMLSNPKLAQSSAYTPAGSESTKTDGLHTVADTYHAGTGLTLLSCACSATRWSLEAGYDYYWRVDGYAANQVTARVTARF